MNAIVYNEHTVSRGLKRFFRKTGMTDPVRQAYDEGQALAYFGPRSMPSRLRSNPYPQGRRHDAWEYGYSTHTENYK